MNTTHTTQDNQCMEDRPANDRLQQGQRHDRPVYNRSYRDSGPYENVNREVKKKILNKCSEIHLFIKLPFVVI